MNRIETAALLATDSLDTLINTWNEYSDDTPIPTDNRTYLIEKILDLMTIAGDITASPTFKLPDLARELGLNPKTARDKLRKSPHTPPPLTDHGWVFATTDREAVVEIIRRRK